MPSLQDSLQTDLSGYTPVPQGSVQTVSAPSPDRQPTLNPMLRCPLPLALQSAPDSLRQFYQGGMVPQSRLLTADSKPSFSGTVNVTERVSVSTSSSVISGSSPATTAATTPTPAPTPSTGTSSGMTSQIAVQSAVLPPGQFFLGTLPISRSCQFVSASANAPCRIELYSTALTQSQDISRPLDTAPPAGTTQGLVFDLVLDQAPYQFLLGNITASNGDSPQTPQMYITITNVSTDATSAITVTLLYVPLET